VDGLPIGIQMDWEALLESDYAHFAASMLHMIRPILKASNAVETLPSIRETLPTVQHVIESLLYEVSVPS
jgi:hypothetical protein